MIGWTPQQPGLGDPSPLLRYAAAAGDSADELLAAAQGLWQLRDLIGAAWSGAAGGACWGSLVALHGRCAAYVSWAEQVAAAASAHEAAVADVIVRARGAVDALDRAVAWEGESAARVVALTRQRQRIADAGAADPSWSDQQVPRRLEGALAERAHAQSAMESAAARIAQCARDRSDAEYALIHAIGMLAPVTGAERRFGRILGLPPAGMSSTDIAVAAARQLRDRPWDWALAVDFLDLERGDAAVESLFWRELGATGAAALADQLRIVGSGGDAGTAGSPDPAYAEARRALQAARSSFARASSDWTADQARAFAGPALRGDDPADPAIVLLMQGPPFAGAQITRELARRMAGWELSHEEPLLLQPPRGTQGLATLDAAGILLAAVAAHPQEALALAEDLARTPAGLAGLLRDRDWSIDRHRGVAAFLLGIEQAPDGPGSARVAAVVGQVVTELMANPSLAAASVGPDAAASFAAAVSLSMPGFAYVLAGGGAANAPRTPTEYDPLDGGGTQFAPSIAARDVTALMTIAHAYRPSSLLVSASVDGYAATLLARAADPALSSGQVVDLLNRAGEARGAIAGIAYDQMMAQAEQADADERRSFDTVVSLLALAPFRHPVIGFAVSTVAANALGAVWDIDAEERMRRTIDDLATRGGTLSEFDALAVLWARLGSPSTIEDPRGLVDVEARRRWIERYGDRILTDFGGGPPSSTLREAVRSWQRAAGR